MRKITRLEEVKKSLRTAVKKPLPIKCCQIEEEFEVESMEGVVKGKKGDWLMVGVEGELYICDHKIFEKTYTLLTD